ncbi:VOC family protein [Agrococcus sp. KRD186]|jgi:catechol 2,3-dioxygenase-like lactoylglutathione lyase family enzyme|uniref:VOC family protein n=1 Tax=Agrococcus sp. KRD186 TaxID=2729730 RepID=UPI0019D1D995|nr:VOC family protein [Agrococcus sp. KRD186]
MITIDAIGMVAQDMPATLAFYRALGLDIPAEADDEPHAEATLPGGLRLMWDTEATIRSFDPDYRREPGQSHTLAARCDSAAEVDATVARLVGLGHRVVREPWDAAWGQRYATVADPDGRGVDLYAAL